MLLLDTHALIFLLTRPDRLSKPATAAIRKAETTEGIAIASITLWEIALLIQTRRVSIRGSTESFLKHVSSQPWLVVLELTPEIAAAAVQFGPDFPQDPADRIIAATSQIHGLQLVSKDERLQDSPLLRTLW